MKTIDFHVHPLPQIQFDHLMREMEAAKVDKAVLLSMDLDPDIIKRKRVRNDINKHFDYTNFILDIETIYSGMDYVLNMGHTPMEHVAKLVQKSDKFIGFGSVHIGYKSNRYIKSKLAQLKQFKDEFGFQGIKILPTLQFFNPADSGLEMIFKFAEKYDLIILYHTGCDPGPWEMPLLSKYGNPKLIEPLVRKYNTKVVLAHMGSYSSQIPGIWFDEALHLMENYSTVFGDISAVPYLMTENQSVVKIREKSLFSRVLYGSDYPVTSAGDTLGMSSVYNLVSNSEYLSEEEKEYIFYLNASKLLQLE